MKFSLWSFAFLVLSSVWCAGNEREMLPSSEYPLLPMDIDSEFGQEISAETGLEFGQEISAETGLYLGQKTRRRGGKGGRFWGNFYYGGSSIRPQEIPKIQPDFYGLQLGFDAVQSSCHSTYFMNINQSDAKSELRSQKIENYLFGFGKFYYLRYCHFGYTASAGYDRYGVVDNGIKGDGDGLQANLFGEFGVDLPMGRWRFHPFYALQYDFLYHGKIDSSLAVLYRDWNGHGLEQLMGLRADWKITDSLTIQTRATWVRELLTHVPPYYHVRFSPMQGIQTPAIMFFEGNAGRNTAWLGGGIKLENTFNILTYLDYDALVSSRHVTHLGSFGFCLNW